MLGEAICIVAFYSLTCAMHKRAGAPHALMPCYVVRDGKVHYRLNHASLAVNGLL